MKWISESIKLVQDVLLSLSKVNQASTKMSFSQDQQSTLIADIHVMCYHHRSNTIDY